MEKEIFINLVKSLKEDFGVSQRLIGERIGRSRSYVNNLIVKGTGRVTQEEIDKLKTAFPELVTEEEKARQVSDTEIMLKAENYDLNKQLEAERIKRQEAEQRALELEKKLMEVEKELMARNKELRK